MTKEQLLQEISKEFRCFGGGNGSQWNPIARALKDEPLQFAAGVDVEDVIDFIIENLKNK